MIGLPRVTRTPLAHQFDVQLLSLESKEAMELMFMQAEMRADECRSGAGSAQAAQPVASCPGGRYAYHGRHR